MFIIVIEVPRERAALWFCFLVSPQLNELRSRLCVVIKLLGRRFLKMKEEWSHFGRLKERLKILEAAEQKVF